MTTGKPRHGPWTRTTPLQPRDDLCPGSAHGRRVKRGAAFKCAEPSLLQEASGCCLGGTYTGFPGPVYLTPFYLPRLRFRSNFILRSLNLSFTHPSTEPAFVEPRHLFVRRAKTGFRQSFNDARGRVIKPSQHGTKSDTGPCTTSYRTPGPPGDL